jgi:hypothetical protein
VKIGRIIGSVVIGIIALSVGWAFMQDHGAKVPRNVAAAAPSGPAQAASGTAKITNGGKNCGQVTLHQGHYLGAITDNYPYKLTAYHTFVNRAGSAPNIIPYFVPWDMPFNELAACQTIHLHALPLIQINPRLVNITSIADGHYNKYLLRYARAVKKFKHTIAISFGHEMNGSWYPWGYKHVSGAAFVRAWRTIHRQFTKVGARNVVWVWTVNREGPGISPLKNWWPGNAYVNWVGIDGHYIHPADTFNSTFGATIRGIRKLTSDPVLIAETAVAPGSAQPGQLANLFTSAGHAPGILGFVWFNIDARYHWHLGSDLAGEDEFRREAKAYLTARAASTLP